MQVVERDKWKLLLKSIEFFKIFDESELDELLSNSNVKKYGVRDWIIKEDREADSFFVILRGKANIIKENYAKAKRTIGEINEGDCFGEMAVLLKQARSASVMAGTETFIFEISAGEIENLKLETQLKLYRRFAIVLATRLKVSSSKIADI